jgi:hypothetical protein
MVDNTKAAIVTPTAVYTPVGADGSVSGSPCRPCPLLIVWNGIVYAVTGLSSLPPPSSRPSLSDGR